MEERPEEEKLLGSSENDGKDHEHLTQINSDDSPLDKSNNNESQGLNFLSMSRDKKFTIITFCFASFCVEAFYSLLAPFFPQEVSLYFIFDRIHIKLSHIFS